jgi:hypothetical protein
MSAGSHRADPERTDLGRGKHVRELLFGDGRFATTLRLIVSIIVVAYVGYAIYMGATHDNPWAGLPGGCEPFPGVTNC